MSTVLLVVIYVAFVGLGIPDSLFGAAWPAVYADLGVPVSWGLATARSTPTCSTSRPACLAASSPRR